MRQLALSSARSANKNWQRNYVCSRLVKKMDSVSSFNDTNLLHSVVCLKPGVWPHGGRTKMVTTIVS
jgi:hypothetical protein